MSQEKLLEELDNKISGLIETIELYKLQIEDLELQLAKVHKENSSMKNRQDACEKSLSAILSKLALVDNKTTQKQKEEEAVF